MKSGFVVLVGRSNVGKSTLLNTLVGTKIAATSFRAQMTRSIIHGVIQDSEGQAIIVDTPGVLKGDKSQLTAKLFNKVKEALQDIDVIVYVVDPTREIGAEERTVMGLIRQLPQPKFLVINKTDLPERRRPYQADYERLAEDFTAVFSLSAEANRHITPLKKAIFAHLPEGEELYPPEQMTNISNQFWIAEIIREKVFSVLDKEIPYAATVEVESVEHKTLDDKRKKNKNLVVITAKILTSADRYKRVIIGQHARRVKEIGQLARRELETALNSPVYLDLTVSVDAHWVERV